MTLRSRHPALPVTCIAFLVLMLLACGQIFGADSLSTASRATADSALIAQKLRATTHVQSVDPLQTTLFPAKFLLRFEQPVNHNLPANETFLQRVVVGHAGFDRPTVLVTEGYGAQYALSSGYIDELAKLFNTNLVVVEHRYFLESAPTQKAWEHLTVEQAVNDLHAIVNRLKSIYPGKWISTGISKGGQTAIYHKAWFPYDTDIAVPYVAPICKAVEDGRHEPFLRKVGTRKERVRIETVQKEILRRKSQLLPLFTEYCKQRKYNFRVPLQEVYDLSVLEYSFSTWQWGSPISQIPPTTASDQELFDHWMKISDPDYFKAGDYFDPFFVQAAREIGYYGYSTKSFRKYLTRSNIENYLPRVFLNEDQWFPFEKEAYNRVKKYLRKEDPKMIFVYGENDPWTAAGIRVPRRKEEMMRAEMPGGSHRTRINSLPEPLKTEVIQKISGWLSE